MKTFIITFFLGIMLMAMATEKPIRGIVRDRETNIPLPFTNIAVQGKFRGTVSNSEGNYAIDVKEISSGDSIIFSYVGYRIYSISVSDLMKDVNVFLTPVAINLKAVQVSNRPLSAIEIIRNVKKNYKKNYVSSSTRQNIFFHKYEKVPFSGNNQIVVIESDFVGLDKNLANELLEMLPDDFIEYQDAIVDLYSQSKEYKLIPVEAVSLEEGSMQTLGKEIENKLSVFLEDMETTMKNDDVYYKVRSGVFSKKIKSSGVNDSLWNENKNDTLNYTVETSFVQDEIVKLLKDYASLESKNWDFIHDKPKYNYAKDDVTMYKDEMVYKISFVPKNRGLFEGTAYISTTTFAVLQLDFAFAEDKQSENFQLLGFGHSMDYKRGRVIFEKGEKGYFAKYIYATQNESAFIDRDLIFSKKQKRSLTDKELNEIKLELKMQFNIESYWEMLVLEREEIKPSQFERAEQPMLMKYRKEYAYNPEMWSNGTVIVPTPDLKKYTRK